MAKSRRDFLSGASVLMATAAACHKTEQKPGVETPPAGEPPAFGTSTEVGPSVSTATFVEGGKLVRFELKPDESRQAADSWRKTMAAVYERRTGPRKFAPDAATARATLWNPMLPGLDSMPGRNGSCAARPMARPCRPTTRTSLTPRWRSFRAGSNRAS